MNAVLAVLGWFATNWFNVLTILIAGAALWVSIVAIRRDARNTPAADLELVVLPTDVDIDYSTGNVQHHTREVLVLVLNHGTGTAHDFRIHSEGGAIPKPGFEVRLGNIEPGPGKRDRIRLVNSSNDATPVRLWATWYSYPGKVEHVEELNAGSPLPRGITIH